MKNKIILFLVSVLLLQFHTVVSAENTGVNTFCDRTVSPVIKSMGDTGVCLDNDLSTVVYNPAAVSFLNKGGIRFNYSTCLGLGSMYDLLYVYKGSCSAFGVEMKFFGLEGFDLYDQNFKKIYSASASDRLFSGLYSYKLNNKVNWGNKINYFQGSLVNQDYSYLTIDSGLFYKVSEKINWGSSIRNIPVVNKEWNNGTQEKIFYSLETGVSYNIHLKNKRIITVRKRVPVEEITNKGPLGFIQNTAGSAHDNKKIPDQNKTKQNLSPADDLEDSLLPDKKELNNNKKIQDNRTRKKDAVVSDISDDLLGDEIKAAEDYNLDASLEEPGWGSNSQSDEPVEIPTRIITIYRTGYYYHDIIFSTALNYSGYYNSLQSYHFGVSYEFQKTMGLGAGLIYRSPDSLFIFSAGLTVRLSFLKAAYALYFHPVQSEHNAGISINF